MGHSAPFLNRLFTPSDTLKELHAALHQLVAFYVDEVGAGLSVLRNENGLATPLKVVEQFGGLTLQGRDKFARCSAWLAGVSQLFTKHSPKRRLKRLSLTFHMLTKRAIDQGLIVPAARLIDLGFEPFDQVVIQADGDASFARRDLNNGPALGFREVVYLAHQRSS